eukprot:4299777-Pyramimonas_sp.AAC.1
MQRTWASRPGISAATILQKSAKTLTTDNISPANALIHEPSKRTRFWKKESLNLVKAFGILIVAANLSKSAGVMLKWSRTWIKKEFTWCCATPPLASAECM